jgi:hypothetical protein
MLIPAPNIDRRLYTTIAREDLENSRATIRLPNEEIIKAVGTNDARLLSLAF